MGKRHFQRPNANLLIINQRVWGGFRVGEGVTQTRKESQVLQGALEGGGKKNCPPHTTLPPRRVESNAGVNKA